MIFKSLFDKKKEKEKKSFKTPTDIELFDHVMHNITATQNILYQYFKKKENNHKYLAEQNYDIILISIYYSLTALLTMMEQNNLEGISDIGKSMMNLVILMKKEEENMTLQ